MAASFELWSFVKNFNQLLDCGVWSEMHVSSTDGKIKINLYAEVESSAFLQPSNDSVKKIKLNPSKLCRRQRRRNARIKNSNARSSATELNVITTTEAVNNDSLDATTTTEDYESVLSPAPTMERATVIINVPQVHTAVQAVCETKEVASGDETLLNCLSSSIDRTSNLRIGCLSDPGRIRYTVVAFF